MQAQLCHKARGSTSQAYAFLNAIYYLTASCLSRITLRYARRKSMPAFLSGGT